MNKIESVERQAQQAAERWKLMQRKNQDLEHENQRLKTILEELTSRVKELKENGKRQSNQDAEEWKIIREEVSECLVEVELCLNELREK